MDIKFTIAAIAGTICFFISFFSMLLISKRLYPEEWKINSEQFVFVPFFLTFALGVSLSYFIIPDFSDFIYEINYTEILVPLVFTATLYCISIGEKTAKYTPFAILLACVASVFFLPEDSLIISEKIPFWADRLLVIAIWFALSNFYYILNGIDGVLPLQNIGISIGIIILGILEATPYLYSLFAVIYLSISLAYAIFNWYPARLQITKTSAQTIGFLTGWLLLINAAEGSSSSQLILIMFFIVELIGASIKKLTLRNKFSNLTSNTVYYQANVSGLSPFQICSFLTKLQIIFIILGAFQIYAPNPYSLPLLALVIGAWFLSKLQNWQTPDKSLRELNRDFMEDIKQNIEELKNNIGKD